LPGRISPQLEWAIPLSMDMEKHSTTGLRAKPKFSMTPQNFGLIQPSCKFLGNLNVSSLG